MWERGVGFARDGKATEETLGPDSLTRLLFPMEPRKGQTGADKKRLTTLIACDCNGTEHAQFFVPRVRRALGVAPGNVKSDRGRKGKFCSSSCINGCRARRRLALLRAVHNYTMLQTIVYQIQGQGRRQNAGDGAATCGAWRAQERERGLGGGGIDHRGHSV